MMKLNSMPTKSMVLACCSAIFPSEAVLLRFCSFSTRACLLRSTASMVKPCAACCALCCWRLAKALNSSAELYLCVALLGVKAVMLGTPSGRAVDVACWRYVLSRAVRVSACRLVCSSMALLGIALAAPEPRSGDCILLLACRSVLVRVADRLLGVVLVAACISRCFL